MADGVLSALTGWDWFIVTSRWGPPARSWRGMIPHGVRLAAWVLGVVGAPLLGMIIAQEFQITGVPIWVLYILAFLLVFIVVRLAGALFLKGVRSVGLAGIDRVLGAALGVARAGIVILVAAVIAHRLGFAQSAAWQAAASRPLLETMIEVAQPWLPAMKKA